MTMYSPPDPPSWDPRAGYDTGGYAQGDPGYAELGYLPREDPRYQGAQPPYGAFDPPYEELDEADEEPDDDDLDALPDPNGGIAAAIIAAGIACAVLGLLVVGAAASGLVAQWLTFYAPTGPLSGKAIVSSVVYLVVWPNLHYRLRDKHVDLYKAFLITVALVAIGVVATFPPVYQLFAR
jgi:hypothetical protein